MLQGKHTKSKSFLLQTVLTAALVLAASAVFNATVDIKGIYFNKTAVGASGVERYVAALRQQPYGLVFLERVRVIKTELLRQSDADCFVFGSSHTMNIRREQLPSLFEGCKEVLNISVSGASFEDMVGALGMVANKPNAKRVVIGVAHWTFRLNTDYQWIVEADKYYDGRRTFGLSAESKEDTSSTLGKLLNLINLTYLEKNIEHLLSDAPIDDFPIKVALSDHSNLGYSETVFLADGSIVRSAEAWDRVPPPENINVVTFRTNPPYINPQIVTEFKKMLSGLIERGIEPIIIMIPYHPKNWKCSLKTLCDGMRASEEQAREISALMGIPLVGSLNPAKFNISGDEFHDNQHMTSSSMHKLAPAPGLLRPLYQAE